MSKKKDLVQIIRENPGCIAVIDNDCWWLWRDEAHRDSGDDPLASDGEVQPLQATPAKVRLTDGLGRKD